MNPAPGPANGAAPANGAPPAGDPAAEPQVPEGFEAPKSPPPEFSIEKELITADEVTALQRSWVLDIGRNSAMRICRSSP
jgi:hypothetical protein